jgi:hypothetical protein
MKRPFALNLDLRLCGSEELYPGSLGLGEASAKPGEGCTEAALNDSEQFLVCRA